ncbi:hypothetical protein [Streptomyces uncialis]|uniref:hypothetical protein n=1 Tax=Streptomyces uncialis TaxID=1048205 RepID=UPI002F93B5EE|nr:hypothetical protein OG924_37190 [Streptomyces uncialis]
MRTKNVTVKRPKRARTKNTNHQDIIKISTLRPHLLNLRPGELAMVCLECTAWTTIHGERTAKLAAHRPDNKTLCPGSYQLIDLDQTVTEWLARLHDANADAASRRRTRVLPKPKTPPLPATTQVKPAPLTAETVRRAFRTHQERCTACQSQTRDGGELLLCADGQRMAGTYLRLLRQEPKRAKAREFFARERRRFDQQYAAQMPKRRATEWAAALPAVTQADDQRHQVVAPAPPATSSRSIVNPQERIRRAASWPQPMHGGPGVPLEPLRPRHSA